jgi:hypothetical protein
MTPRHAVRRAALSTAAAALVTSVALAGCSGEEPATRPATAAPSTSTPTTTPTPKPSPTLAALAGGPVLAVKIDNTPSARPRIGLNQADVVYVEPVEGGLTRLLAVFSTRMPAEVGPVRSARESDVDLLGNYGKVAFAYSGGSPYTLRLLPRGQQVNLSFDASRTGFHRDPSRPAPYNVVGETKALLARAGGSVRPQDIGFRYGPPAAGGTAASSVTARWPGSRVTLTWSAQRKQYLVTTDGRPDTGADRVQHGASTVVVQYVRTRLSGNRDVNGMPTPVVQVTGSGKATVLRGGKVWNGAWSRKGVAAPTSITAAGKPVTMAPGGPVWVLLVAPGQAVTVR